jgi:hypothetical protein
MHRMGFRAVAVLFALGMMSILSCSQSSGGSDPEPEPPASPSYAITFTFDGQSYNFDKGFTDESAVPFGQRFTTTTPKTTRMDATPDATPVKSANYIELCCSGDTIGDYDIITAGASVISLAGIVYEPVDISLSITEYGAVGEALAGIFNGTFKKRLLHTRVRGHRRGLSRAPPRRLHWVYMGLLMRCVGRLQFSSSPCSMATRGKARWQWIQNGPGRRSTSSCSRSSRGAASRTSAGPRSTKSGRSSPSKPDISCPWTLRGTRRISTW